MSKETVKTQIDTDITNKTTSKSISPLNVGGNMKAIVDLIPDTTYKVYKFRISQTGDTSDPTVLEFKNDIGIIVWTRTAIGRYRATLTGAFDPNKTSVGQINRCQHSGAYTRNIFVNHNSNNYFEIWVTNQTETALEGLYEEFEIIVYN